MQLVGPMWVLAALLVLAGFGKLVRPAATGAALRAAALPAPAIGIRFLGLLELTIGATVLWRGGPLAAGGLAVAYGLFAAFLLRLRARAGAASSCACLGPQRAPVTRLHIGFDLAAVAVALTAVFTPLPPATSTLAASPLRGLPTVVALVVAVALARMMLTDLPVVLQRTHQLATGRGTRT